MSITRLAGGPAGASLVGAARLSPWIRPDWLAGRRRLAVQLSSGTSDPRAACARFLSDLGVEVALTPLVRSPGEGLIVYTEYGGLLDALALPLAVDGPWAPRYLLGQGVARLTGLDRAPILVADGRGVASSPMSALSGALLRGEGASPPGVTHPDGLRGECVAWLRAGGDLLLFAGRADRDAPWDDLLGEIVLDYLRDPDAYAKRLVLGPVKLAGGGRGASPATRGSARARRIEIRGAARLVDTVLPFMSLERIDARSCTRLLNFYHDYLFRTGEAD